MGAFSMQPPGKAGSKPTERIPLPRTDLEKPGDGVASDVVPDSDPNF
jgi:hypothetical protein